MRVRSFVFRQVRPPHISAAVDPTNLQLDQFAWASAGQEQQIEDVPVPFREIRANGFDIRRWNGATGLVVDGGGFALPQRPDGRQRIGDRLRYEFPTDPPSKN